jgi:hypothetical protein
MPKFAVIIHGVNFLLRDPEAAEAELRGFYINAYLDAPTAEEAEAQAIELVCQAPELRALVTNALEDSPRLFVDEIAELTDWPEDCVRPLSGFIFYDDPDAEWRNEVPPA